MLRKTILLSFGFVACTGALIAGPGGGFQRPSLATGGPTSDERAALNDATIQDAVKAVAAVKDDITTLQELRKKMTTQGGMKAYMALCKQAGLMNGMPKPPREGGPREGGPRGGDTDADDHS